MKNRTSLVLLAIIALLALAVFACASGPVTPIGNATGTATGTAQGNGGEVTVTITMEDGFITGVVAKGDGESPTIGGPVLVRAPSLIKRYNSAQFDAVSGATITSMAVAQAAQSAIDQIVAAGSTAEIETAADE